MLMGSVDELVAPMEEIPLTKSYIYKPPEPAPEPDPPAADVKAEEKPPEPVPGPAPPAVNAKADAPSR